MMYLPDPTAFTGSLIVGDGGRLLSHSTNWDGQYNIAVEIGALAPTTIGRHNTASGFFALVNNTTGNFNVALGDLALYDNTTGWDNVAPGLGAN